MAKVVAAGKKRRRQEEAEAQAKLEQAGGQDALVVKRESKVSDSKVSFREINNVIADALERTWEELNATGSFNGETHMRLCAEEGATVITRSLVYGIGDHGGPVKIREDESLTPKFCKEHK